jgi:nitrite reductase/ring-hydroxylating ferredoxin subunit
MTDWYRACALSELVEGEPLGIEIRNTPVGLYRIGDQCYALHDVCTHAYALLSTGFVEGEIVECPLHAAQFCVVTGACLSGPASEGVATYDVKIEGDDVFVRIPAVSSEPSRSG